MQCCDTGGWADGCTEGQRVTQVLELPVAFLPPHARPCRSEGSRLSSRAAGRGGKVTGRRVVRPLANTMGN